MKKTIILLPLFILLFVGNTFAESLEFTVQAPNAVVQGDQFRLSYTINTQKVKDFRVGSITDFDVLMGPSRSSQLSIINGTKTSSITYTYILRAGKEGTYTIPPATIVAEGKSMESKSVTVKVLPPDEDEGQGSASSSGNGNRQQGSAASSSQNGQVSDKELFLVLQPTKRKCMSRRLSC